MAHDDTFLSCAYHPVRFYHRIDDVLIIIRYEV